MRKLTIPALLAALVLTFACRKAVDIPTEFPTPEPPPHSTPLPQLELKPDTELEKKFASVAEAAKGKVGVSAVVLETGESASLNADGHFPMQSVYKLPISMAVMEQVRLGERDLDEKIGVTKEDMVREGQRSPLRDANPNGGEFTIRELMRLALVESDGTASDVLMRVAGGPSEIQSYLSQIGIMDMRVLNTEKEMGRDWETQYQNWATPHAAAELLRFLQRWDDREREFDPRSQEAKERRVNIPTVSDGAFEILGFMANSTPGKNRLRGLLPKLAVMSHKTGTGGTQNGITSATNDIGIVALPDGKHLAIAVFISDSPGDEKTREAVIAKIAKAAWDKFSNGNILHAAQ